MHKALRTGALVLVVAASLAAAVLLIVPSGPDADTGPQPPPRLAERDGQIVEALTGRPVVLRGANVMRGEWDRGLAHERRVLPLLRRWGGNVVVRGFAADPVLSGDRDYLEQLDELVLLAARTQLHLVLAWRSHQIDGEQPARPDDRAQQALGVLAGRYAARTHVAFALQVEPHDTPWTELRPRFESMVDAIREAAAPHVPLVMVPGTGYSRDVSHAVRDPVRRSGIVYKTHPYSPQADFASLFLAAHAAGLAVFVGEFGPVRGQMTLSDVRALLRLLEDRKIGWAAWVLDAEGGPALLADNATGATSTPYGALVQQAMERGQ